MKFITCLIDINAGVCQCHPVARATLFCSSTFQNQRDCPQWVLSVYAGACMLTSMLTSIYTNCIPLNCLNYSRIFLFFILFASKVNAIIFWHLFVFIEHHNFVLAIKFLSAFFHFYFLLSLGSTRCGDYSVYVCVCVCVFSLLFLCVLGFVFQRGIMSHLELRSLRRCWLRAEMSLNCV